MVHERSQGKRALARFVLAVALAGVLCGSLRPRQAFAAQSYVDRRVTALAPTALLHLPPAALVDPRRQRAAVRFRRWTRPIFFFSALSQIVALFLLWASGYGARLRDGLRSRIRPAYALRFAYGALLAVVAGVAELPASLVAYRFDAAYGLSTATPLHWARDGLLNNTVHALLLGAVVTFIFALVDRTRLWYVWAMGGLFALTLLMAFLEPVTVAPLYNHFKPLPHNSVVRAPLIALARRAGIGNAPIEVANFSVRSPAVVADVAGFGPTKRIVLGDQLLTAATTGEVLFLAAREFGHYAHADDFRLSLFWTFLFIVCAALAVILADRTFVRRDDDPLARLSLVLAFLGLLGLAATPLYNGYLRNIESLADAYALALTGDHVSAVRAYVRIADETLSPLCPARSVRLYFYNNPPLGTRIAAAQGGHNPCP